MVMRSSQLPWSFSYFSHFCWSCFMRFCTFWLRSRSFQKPSFALSASSSAISALASSSLSAAPRPSSPGLMPFSFTLYSSNSSISSTAFSKIKPYYYIQNPLSCKGAKNAALTAPRGSAKIEG